MRGDNAVINKATSRQRFDEMRAELSLLRSRRQRRNNRIAERAVSACRVCTSDVNPPFISRLPCNVIELSRAVRSHWSIENSLHWRWDAIFHEDDSRQRTGHSARAFSLIRRIALSLLNQEQTAQKSLRAKCKKATRNPNDLLKVLTGV